LLLEGGNEQILDMTDVLNASVRTTGVAWLYINNQSADAVRLEKGATIVRTASGTSYISSGDNRTYQIDMPTITGTTSFASTLNISSYKVGPSGATKAIGNVDLQVDKMYTVTVNGDQNGTGITVSINTDTPTDVNWDDFNWLTNN
jgi:hypothetical protein